MATTLDTNQPSFFLFPINNNRTAWRPVRLPIILVVPHTRDATGAALENSDVFSIRIYIENVPKESLIAGPQHIGQRFPDKELYSQTISQVILGERLIPATSLSVTDGIATHTTTTGTTSTIPYIADAAYYDLSDIETDVELLPPDAYNLVYETRYYNRVVSTDGRNDFLCINANEIALALFKFVLDHPGQVLEEFYRLTPPPYLTNAKKSEDTTVALYRPLTDIMQDISDEQSLLERVNWVFDAPAEIIPYLSSLLGWDIPYFPQSLDQLRRAVLRRTVEFQNLKGSRRVIINIFRLFGFEILISNLWWSADGKILIRPDQTLPAPYAAQQITTVGKNQVDPIVANYAITEFTTLTIPLLFRPQEKTGLDQFTALHDAGKVTIAMYAVTPGSDADIALAGITAQATSDPSGYGTTANCQADADGFLFPEALTTALAGKTIEGYSQIHIAGKAGTPVEATGTGNAVPLLLNSIMLNRETNELHLTINGVTVFEDLVLYGFAIYQRYEFDVPAAIVDLQSNRFDLQVLTKELDEFADPTTLDFAAEFLFKLKAFHSLLNAIRTSIELTETYQVTDLCVGGSYIQRFDTGIGRLQVPPAITPNIPANLSDCASLDPVSLGYKPTDLLLRTRILNNLEEEFAAWQRLDGRPTATGATLLPPVLPIDSDTCQFNYNGQDRVIESDRTETTNVVNSPPFTANNPDNASELSPQDFATDTTTSNSDRGGYGSFMRELVAARTPLCEPAQTDYCYKGRVEDELLYRLALTGTEYARPKPSIMSMGIGVYWVFPSTTVTATPGTRMRDSRSKTARMTFSGDAPESGLKYYQTGAQQSYLTTSLDAPLPHSHRSMLGNLYRSYGEPSPETLHFSNRNDEPVADQRRQLALQRPSLEIQKATMHFPGCRFPTMSRLKDNYTSSEYRARPWDFSLCGPRGICGPDTAYLNTTLVADITGNETLVFDDAPYTVLGNNLDPDIDDLSDPSKDTGAIFTNADVVHAVYMEAATDNAAVALAGVVPYDTPVADGVIDILDPIFPSYNSCATDPTQFSDFAEGYPAVTGLQSYTSQASTLYDTVLSALGMPADAATGQQVLFLLISGIKDGSNGTRMDGGCELLGCAGTGDIGSTICTMDYYLDSDGYYDFNPDHLTIIPRLVAEESTNTDTVLLNNVVPSLMELL